MTRHDTLQNDGGDQLSELLHDAVNDIEPNDRLGELRARTSASPSSHRWWIGAGGAALATAAVVTAIAVVGTDPPTAVDPPPADTPTSSAVPAYFVGDTPRGPRLYREFQQVVEPTPGLAGLALLESGPDDPDYTSLWSTDSFGEISGPEAGVVILELTDSAPADPSDLAIQQLVYTLNAAFQEPLQVDVHGPSSPRDDLGPLITSATAAPQLDVLSLVNLSDPFEGQVVGDTLHVEGRANSNEATVVWTIEGNSVGMEEAFTAEGWMGTRLFPFSGDIDVSSLDPGTYTLTVETSDLSGGAEGFDPYSDTRTFVIE